MKVIDVEIISRRMRTESSEFRPKADVLDVVIIRRRTRTEFGPQVEVLLLSEAVVIIGSRMRS